ncbi:MAG: sigma-70 family RNA polymerase sigma factor, partial [candidate division WOR-3 bacterium]
MLEDSELVRKAKHGDESSFDELVRRYQQRVYAIAFRLVRNSEDAREVAQDVFVKVYRSLPGFRERSTFYTWLYRIAVNQALSLLRKYRRQPLPAVDHEQLESEAIMNLPSRESPERDFHQARLRQ